MTEAMRADREPAARKGKQAGSAGAKSTAMDERKRRILCAIVEDYVETAAPVGSRTVCGKYLAELSSATIRNEMGSLTALGYLEQPHVSAGRVPTASAYRFYVDGLDGKNTLSPSESARINREMLSRVKQLSDVVQAAADVLSDMTNYAAVVMMPKQEDLRILSLHLVPITRASALIVVVTDGGIIRDSHLHVSDVLDHEALFAISRMLSDRLRNKTLREAQQMLRGYAQNAPWDPQVLDGIAELAAQLERQSASDSLRVAGSHHMLRHPEYSDVRRARDMLGALSETEQLLGLLKEDAGRGVTVRIGPESGIPQMEDLSIVTASYEVGRGHQGAIGVIGPTRMPYPRVLSILKSAGSTLSHILTRDND